MLSYCFSKAHLFFDALVDPINFLYKSSCSKANAWKTWKLFSEVKKLFAAFSKRPVKEDVKGAF